MSGSEYMPLDEARSLGEPEAEHDNERDAPHEDAWPRLAPDALHGLAGDVVRAIEPHTESDPVAILIQFHVQFGNALGRGPNYQVEGDKHSTNLFAVLVGQTSKARKGTSAGRVRQVLEVADPDWAHNRIHSGLSSGEGLIWAVRDPISRWAKSGEGTEAAESKVDPGVADKRLMIIEPEFAGALTVMQRPGNILSRVIRDAWDRGNLASLTKHTPDRATGAHISIVGHITEEELRRNLDHVSMANGYANRFLFACVRRAQFLPHGGSLPEDTVRDLGACAQAAIHKARTFSRVGMTPETREAWECIYPALSEGHAGLLGAIVGRAEAQTIRLALLYALLDSKTEIGIEHLRAAVAVWEYCEASVHHIFGDLLGNPISDEILRALRRAGERGMSRTDIRDLFGRHRSSNQIELALSELSECGKVRRITRGTGGRPAEVWIAALKG